MSVPAKRHQAGGAHRCEQHRHITRPSVPRDVQSSLLTVGMRVRKAASDSAFKNTTAAFSKPIAVSNLSSSRMTPYAETKQRDPFEAFRLKGQADFEARQAQQAFELARDKIVVPTVGQAGLKRSHTTYDDETATVVDEDEDDRDRETGLREVTAGRFISPRSRPSLRPTQSLPLDVFIPDQLTDPNWEFTNPPWLCSQESLMDDAQHEMRD
ncbi:hypothetical protein PYCC9005_001158 [Savitreella phatthalungensis]